MKFDSQVYGSRQGPTIRGARPVVHQSVTLHAAARKAPPYVRTPSVVHSGTSRMHCTGRYRAHELWIPWIPYDVALVQ